MDKETIAKLDEAQLNQIVGGVNDNDADESACPFPASNCTAGTCSLGTSCQAARP